MDNKATIIQLNSVKNRLNIWWVQIFVVSLHPQTSDRALSSVGSERLPYKQRVGGSNPSAPTKRSRGSFEPRLFSYAIIDDNSPQGSPNPIMNASCLARVTATYISERFDERNSFLSSTSIPVKG